MYKRMSDALFSSVELSGEGKCQWHPLVQVTIRIEEVSPHLFLHGKTRIYLWCNRAKKRKSGQFLICRHVIHIHLFIYTCGTLCTYHPAWGQAAHCFLLTTCLRWSSLSAATMGSSFCRWYEIRWLMLSNNMSLVRTCREDSKRGRE